MSAPDLRIKKEPGLNRRNPTNDDISGLVCGGVATDDVALGDIVELRSPLDAEAKGIDAAYDADNAILVYHRVKRFFKRNPSGTLFLMLVQRGTTLEDMCDKTKAYLKKMLDEKQGLIKQAGVALNPEDDYDGVYNTGIDADVIAAVTKAQALCDEQWDLHRPVQILIEGYHFNGTATNAPDLRSLDSENVSVVIGADPIISNQGQNKTYYAAVEDALGAVSAAKVNECIGWVGKFNLQDLSDDTFVTAGLSSGLAMSNYSEVDIDTLHDKGYVFCRYHSNKTGVFFVSSPTCTAISNDEAYIENGRTLAKAARVIRREIIDDLNGPLLLNEDGTIRADVIGELEAKAEKGLTEMKKAGEVSAFDVWIDPTQKPYESDEETFIDFEIVGTAVNRTIKGRLKLVSSL